MANYIFEVMCTRSPLALRQMLNENNQGQLGNQLYFLDVITSAVFEIYPASLLKFQKVASFSKLLSKIVEAC